MSYARVTWLATGGPTALATSSRVAYRLTARAASSGEERGGYSAAGVVSSNVVTVPRSEFAGPVSYRRFCGM